MSSIHRATLLVGLVTAMSFRTGIDTLGLADEPIYELQTDKQVDEQLFLVRRLEALHEVFSADTSDAQLLAADLMSTRYEMARLKEYVQAKSMDGRLVQLNSDSLELLDHYSRVLMDIGAIDQEFERELSEHNFKTIAGGVREGLEAGSGMAVLGIEPITATTMIAGLAIENVHSAHQERLKLRDDKELSKLRRLHQFDVERSRLLGRIQVQAGVLAEKFNWSTAEVGFDTTPEVYNHLLEALELGDYRALREHFEMVRERRPRDPYVQSAIAQFRMLEASLVSDDQGDSERVSILRKAVQEQIRAAELVPADRSHDPLRAEFLLAASDHATTALYFANKTSNYPLRLANAALRYQPGDPSGQIRMARANALARNGEFTRAIEALEKLGRLQPKDAAYHFDMACYLSAAAKTEEALERLQLAWKAGRKDVGELRRRHELEAVRKDHSEDFQRLVAPQWKVELSYGYVWNDCIIENHSTYPFTNAVVKARWQNAAGDESVEVYFVNSIPSLSRQVLSGAFDPAVDDSESPPKLASELLCDETRSVAPTKIADAVGTFRGTATLLSEDGAQVFDSSTSQLIIQTGSHNAVTAEFVAQDRRLEFSVGPIRDSKAILSVVNEEQAIGKIWFSGEIAYGWFIEPGQEDGRRTTFWLDRQQRAN